MFRLSVAHLLVAAVMLFVGCSSRIDGEVFIVTKAGEPKKLALVDVYAFKIADMDGFRKSLLSDLAGFLKIRASTMLESPNPVLSLDTVDERKLFSERVIRSVLTLTRDVPTTKAQSDADGRFQMDLGSGEYLIVAIAARQALNEEYLWLLKTPINGKLRLANDSMFDQGCDLCVLSQNELKFIRDARTAAIAEVVLEFEKRAAKAEVERELEDKRELLSYDEKDCKELKKLAASYPNSDYAARIESYMQKRWGSTACR